MSNNFNNPIAWVLTRYGHNGEEQSVNVFVGDDAFENAKTYAANWAEHDLEWCNVAIKTYTAQEMIVGYSFKITGVFVNPTWTRSSNHNRKLTHGY